LSSANFTGKPSAAAAAAVTVDGKDAATERLRLDISPQPNDNGELVKAVGSSVVFTCYRVTADDDSDDDLSAEATTIAWLDKNDIVIPSHTNHRYDSYYSIISLLALCFERCCEVGFRDDVSLCTLINNALLINWQRDHDQDA